VCWNKGIALKSLLARYRHKFSAKNVPVESIRAEKKVKCLGLRISVKHLLPVHDNLVNEHC